MLTVRPVGPADWDDLAALFGPSGAYSGCWCMWWRISGRQFSENGNAGNKKALRALVTAGEPVGLLAYTEDGPIGWCTVAPRSAYQRILRSPQLKPADADEAGVWSVPCFYVRREHRGAGVASTLLAGAVRYAQAEGASAVEGYAIDASLGPVPPPELFTGTVGQFERAGFVEYARPKCGRRVIMRREVAAQSPPR